MNRFVLGMPLLLACHCLTASASEQGSSPAPQPIRAVWATTQSCMGVTAERLKHSSDEDKIRTDGAVELKQLGVRYQIPYVPAVDRFALKVIVDDTSRGVVDNYVLISGQDLKAPFGALVVTALPPAITTADSAFGAVDQLQRGLAQSAYPIVQRRDISDARLGRGVEYVTPNRMGTFCFPTSKYQFVPPGIGLKTIGISRFFIRGNELVEMAYIVTLPEAIPASGANDFARSEMDRYLAGLTLTDPGGSDHR